MQLEKDDKTLIIKPDSIQLISDDKGKQLDIANGIIEVSGGIIDISYNNDPDTRFIVSNTGQVGIGVDSIGIDKLKVNGNILVNTPDYFSRYPLTVNGYYEAGTLETRILRENDVTPPQPISNSKISLKVDRSVWIQDGGVLVSSDRRIKTNIEPISDETALNIVNKIQTYQYNYTTDVSGVTPVYGYIAQEVKEHLPYAVTLINNFIPSILQEYNMNDEPPTVNLTDNKVEILLNNIPHDDNNTGRYLFYCYNTDKKQEYREEILGERVNEANVRCLLPCGYSRYFCYGWEVNDFNILNKERINALHHSAIQQLSKENAKLQDTNKQIKEDIALIKETLKIT